MSHIRSLENTLSKRKIPPSQFITINGPPICSSDLILRSIAPHHKQTALYATLIPSDGPSGMIVENSNNIDLVEATMAIKRVKTSDNLSSIASIRTDFPKSPLSQTEEGYLLSDFSTRIEASYNTLGDDLIVDHNDDDDDEADYAATFTDITPNLNSFFQSSGYIGGSSNTVENNDQGMVQDEEYYRDPAQAEKDKQIHHMHHGFSLLVKSGWGGTTGLGAQNEGIFDIVHAQGQSGRYHEGLGYKKKR